MTERYCIGYFENEHDLVEATQEARRRAYCVLDVFTPYPVHHLPQAMALPPSRLVWIGVGAGVMGLALGLILQFWTSASDWPLVVGGQPFNSWPVFIPVSFELTVLFAGVIGVLALLLRSRLWPGHEPPTLQNVTDHRFALVLLQADASADLEEMIAMLKAHRAILVTEGDEVA